MEMKNLKPTGIVRRIDDLGRVVIPREIRRVLFINEGDPLEIFTGNDGTICLKKYNMAGQPLEIIDCFEKSIVNLSYAGDIDPEKKTELIYKIADIKKLLGGER